MPQRAPHKRYGVIVVAAVIAIMGSFLFAANSTVARRERLNQTLTSQKHTDRVICERVNRIYTQISKSVRVSIEQTPKIMYYKTHPADLRRVQKLQQRQLRAFRPQPCPEGG